MPIRNPLFQLQRQRMTCTIGFLGAVGFLLVVATVVHAKDFVQELGDVGPTLTGVQEYIQKEGWAGRAHQDFIQHSRRHQPLAQETVEPRYVVSVEDDDHNPSTASIPQQKMNVEIHGVSSFQTILTTTTPQGASLATDAFANSEVQLFDELGNVANSDALGNRFFASAEEIAVNTKRKDGDRQALSFIETFIKVDEPKTQIPITMVGSTTVTVVFDGFAGNTIDCVVQLKEHRYDPYVSPSNCHGMYIHVELQSVRDQATGDDMAGAKDQHKSSTSSSSSSKDQDEEVRQTAWSSFWNSFAQMFDSSAFCEILPSLSLRISRVKRTRTYHAIIRSSVPGGTYTNMTPPQCQLDVYLDQKSASKQQLMQIIFSLILPLVVLLAPMPFLLRRADIIQAGMSDVDLVEWLWSPPYYMRRGIISVATVIYERVNSAIVSRRAISHQQRMEATQRAMQEEMYENQQHFIVQMTTLRIAEAASSTVGLAQKLLIPTPSPPSAVVAANPVSDAHSIAPITMSVSTDNVNDSRAGDVTEVLILSPARHREELEDDLSSPSIPLVLEKSKDTTERSSRHLLFTTDLKGDGDDEGEEKFCRICRDGAEEAPLVAPCACTGSVRWVHQTCLDHWRLESAKRNLTHVNNCEICKKPFTISINRRTLLLQSSSRVIKGILLFITCCVTLTLITLISHRVFGELSCVADYHEVAYASMFTFEGILLSVFLYSLCQLLILFAYMVVFSWFMSRPEVEAYISEMHVFPPFLTSRNVLLIVLVGTLLLAQGIAMGFLFKNFLYATSSIVWNWEISPMLGGMMYLIFITFALGISNSIRETIVNRQGTAGEAQDIVVEDAVTDENPTVSAHGGANDGEVGVAGSVSVEVTAADGAHTSSVSPHILEGAAPPPTDSTNPPLRILRATEYCPPRFITPPQ